MTTSLSMMSCQLSSCHSNNQSITSAPIPSSAPPKKDEVRYFNPTRSHSVYFLSYAEPSGEIATVDHINGVPVDSRGRVRVDIPNMPPPSGKVWLVDLSKQPSSTTSPMGYPLTVITEAAWHDMTQSLASQLSDNLLRKQNRDSNKAIPRVESSQHKVAQSYPKQSHRTHKKITTKQVEPAKKKQSEAQQKATADVALTRAAALTLTESEDSNASATNNQKATRPISVVVYGTSWCPACRAARQYFRQNGIRYRNIDVDSNQAAAAKMASIQRSNGYPIGSIPLIVIGGRAYQGFSPLGMASIIARVKASQS